MYFLLFLLLANIYGYAVMYNDKQRAKRKEWRISEAHLFTAAALGGSLGVWLGTKAPLFHKSAHWQFRLGVPLIMLAQAVFVFFYYR